MVPLGHWELRNPNIRCWFKSLWESKNLQVPLRAQVYLHIGLTTLNTETCRNSGGRLQLTYVGKWIQTSARVRPHSYKPVWSVSATWQLVGSKIPRTPHLDRRHKKLNNAWPLINSNKLTERIWRILTVSNILQSKPG